MELSAITPTSEPFTFTFRVVAFAADAEKATVTSTLSGIMPGKLKL